MGKVPYRIASTAPGILAALDSYRNNAHRGYLDALIDKFIEDNANTKDYKGKDLKSWPREYKYEN